MPANNWEISQKKTLNFMKDIKPDTTAEAWLINTELLIERNSDLL